MARPKRFELLTPRFVVWCDPLSFHDISAKRPIAWPKQINGLH